MEWLEALDDMKTRVTTLERQTRDIAQGLARADQAQADNIQKFNVIDKDLTAYKSYVEGVFYHDSNSIKNTFNTMEERFKNHVSVTTEVLQSKSEAIDSQFAVLNSQVEEIKDLLKSKFFNMATPPGQPPDPMQEPQNDAWSQARNLQQSFDNVQSAQPAPAPANNAGPFAIGAAANLPTAADQNQAMPVQNGNSPFQNNGAYGSAPIQAAHGPGKPTSPQLAQMPTSIPASFQLHAPPQVTQSPVADSLVTNADGLRLPASLISPFLTLPPFETPQAAPQQPDFNACPVGQGYGGPAPGGAAINPNVNYGNQVGQLPGWQAANFDISPKNNDALKKFGGIIRGIQDVGRQDVGPPLSRQPQLEDHPRNASDPHDAGDPILVDESESQWELGMDDFADARRISC